MDEECVETMHGDGSDREACDGMCTDAIARQANVNASHSVSTIDGGDDDVDPREQVTINEVRATGMLPYTREAIVRREDAHDRAVVRNLMPYIVDDCKKNALGADGASLPPPEPLGPAGRDVIVPYLFDVASSLVDGAEVRVCLAPDGVTWSAYRTDPQRLVQPSHVGMAGNPWCADPDCPETRCKSCTLILAAVGVNDSTDPARAIPHRWPIGVRWTWTHAQMEDQMIARLRYEPNFMVETTTTRTVKLKGSQGVKVTHGEGGMWNGGEDEAWYVMVAQNAVRDWGSGGGPALAAHDCVVGLAEARHALLRLDFAVRHWRLNARGGMTNPDYFGLKDYAKLRARREGLRGWIGAVEALLRNRTFYLSKVAPYEARLIEAASSGVVSA
ncbi:hypothetical protein pqer_cds_965 [Pandoravirus quercus]|uniref:Uncharacterized protein n=2 Tax=Pandoravirus TaxID=2060084 RepID=A0A2U7UAB4_9VIRU|nr:hypothetical protein pqer_cds_965 [Pandoravirus quercus]AVK75387.1 hypothetical protein pqer_cds_965 [Pandoravirus quercus]QBZ81565.1 hypothetical protein pclt_cds_979 [Pandoravirus celtis]